MGIFDKLFWKNIEKTTIDKEKDERISSNAEELKRKNEVEQQIKILLEIISSKRIWGTSILGAKPEFIKIEQYGSSALDPLIDELKNNQDVIIRWAAAYSLGNIRDKRAIEPLISTLSKHEHPDVQWRAAEALGKIGDEKALGPLNAVLKHEDSWLNYKDPWVREAAEGAIKRIEHKRKVELLIKDFKIRKLIKDENLVEPTTFLLGLRNNKTSYDNEKAIEELKNNDAFQLLCELLLVVDNKRCQKQILDSLKDIKIESIIPILKKVLKEEQDASIRLKVVELLGKMGYASAVTDLIESLDKDKNSSVRLKSAESLGKIRDISAIPHLIQACDDKDMGVRFKAVESLGNLGDSSTINYLNMLINNENEKVREVAKKAVIKIEKRENLSRSR
jgi:HEAT repeat protein